MKTFNTVIQQIDDRRSEFAQFQNVLNRLITIRGKVLHHIKLSDNDVKTLELNNFYIG